MLDFYPPTKTSSTYVVYEKFGIAQGTICPPFSESCETFQAFAVEVINNTYKPAVLPNGKIEYTEYSLDKTRVKAKEKSGFIYSGQIINAAGVAYFKTSAGENKYLTLNGTQGTGGALEESDTTDAKGALDIIEAVAKGALREFAEGVFGLNKAQAKQMSFQEIKNFIIAKTGSATLSCQVLAKKNERGSLERIPTKEFNDLMVSPIVMIDLGTCSEERVANALTHEEGQTAVPQIITQAGALDKAFRNAAQVKHHKENPEDGVKI